MINSLAASFSSIILRRRMRTSSGVSVVPRSSNWICRVSRICIAHFERIQNGQAPRSCLRSKSRCRSSSPRRRKAEKQGKGARPGRRRAYCFSERRSTCALGLQLQQRVRVAVAKASPCRPARAQPRRGTCGPARWRERIVDREHDAVDAEGLQRGDERRLAEDAAGGDPDLIEDGLARRPLKVANIGRADIVERAIITGSISPMWPMIILSLGCLSNVPAITMRSDVDRDFGVPAPAGGRSTRSAPSGSR